MILHGELFEYILFVLVAVLLLGIYFYIKMHQEIKIKKLQEFKEWKEAVNSLNKSEFEKYAEIIKYNFELDNIIFKDKMDYINLLAQKESSQSED